MMSRRSQTLLCLILVLASLWPSMRAAAAQSQLATPDLSAVTLSPDDCSFLLHGEEDPRSRLGDITCGSLDVPENWNQPGERRLQVRYVVLEATGEYPAADPILFLAGGPGTSPLTQLEPWAGVFAPLRQDRDIIFFDQRGTRLSSPLRCEAYSVLLALDLPADVVEAAGGPAALEPSHPDQVDADALLEHAREHFGAPAAACARQLEAAGVDLSQYNTMANAHDAVALVSALGHDDFNLYGVSYGTRLALEIMRSHPTSGIRSVVLDSTYPPEVKSYEQFPQEPHEVVIQLFADCALDPDCNAAYPDLKARFIDLLAHMSEEPVVVADGTVVTDRDLIAVMQGLGNNIRAIPYVPRMISELERGVADTFIGITTGALFAMQDPDSTPDAVQGDRATPDTAPAQLSPARQFVVDLQAELASRPEFDPGQFTQLLLTLDTLPHDRQTLAGLIERAFPEDRENDIRASFLATIDALGDAEVAEVFAVIEQTITLADLHTVGVTVPQYYSIECNERIPFQSFATMVSNARNLEIPELALGIPESFVKVFAICEQWPSGEASPEVEQPVWSEAPTMILAGAYDNLTPVSWNKSAFTTLPNGIFVLAPMSGHGVITFSACAQSIAVAFITNPAVQPDTTCLGDIRPAWAPPPPA
jgi:pimeloyl-ACP methyl ester carboxylesterase